VISPTAESPRPTSERGLERWDALVVEASQSIREQLRDVLGLDLRVKECESAAEARDFLGKNQVRLLIMADDLPDLPGLMFLAETRDLWPGMQRILLCVDLDADLLIHAMKEGGILHYLTKPLDGDAATKVVDYCLQQSALLERLGRTQKLLDLATVRSRDRARETHAGATIFTSALWRVSFWLIFSLTLCFVLVLTGLATVYLLKSSLGFDIFPDAHLADFLPSPLSTAEEFQIDEPPAEE
jgi:response regulator RpfG family c-di-GMP phosphodiesterase